MITGRGGGGALLLLLFWQQAVASVTRAVVAWTAQVAAVEKSGTARTMLRQSQDEKGPLGPFRRSFLPTFRGAPQKVEEYFEECQVAAEGGGGGRTGRLTLFLSCCLSPR